MIEREGLDQRVRRLGSVPHAEVRDVLVQGHTSLTEAFCIAIVEAAACGLKVVTTDIDAIPEVLPERMVGLAPPVAEALEEELCNAIATLPTPEIAAELAESFHEEIRSIYSWQDVAQHVETVYGHVLAVPRHALQERLL